MTCANCDRPLTSHCHLHAVPCCPGKCPGVAAEVPIVHPLVRAIQLRLIAHPMTGIRDLGTVEHDIIIAAAALIETMVGVIEEHDRQWQR